MAQSDLIGQARGFANKIQALLNGTVAGYARVAAVSTPSLGVVAVGTNLAARHLTTSPVMMFSADARYRLFIDVQYQLCMDDEGRHLTVVSSYFGVQGSMEAPDPYFHYDYERDKDGYTEAHLQVFGEHADLQETMGALCTRRKKKQMGELHFPVGGRRFRPAIEDVIEFLVDEQLVRPKVDWQKVLHRSREEFREIQLRAAIRRNPEVARQVLAEIS